MDTIKTNYAIIQKKFPSNIYVPIVEYSTEEKKIIDLFVSALKGKRDITKSEFLEDLGEFVGTVDLENVFPEKIKFFTIEEKIKESLKKFGAKNPDKICGAILDVTFGFGKIGPLLRDPLLEEIMINGEDKSVFVFHREYGMCKTNIIFDKRELTSFITKIARTVGKEFSERNPLLDARLSDGSRANATYDTVTPFGLTLTIRKFSQRPLAITKLIETGTISPELVAFLWVSIDGFELTPQNILVVGGTGTGKTTLLLALTSFIRPSNRIITIEDTPELNLHNRDNWISMESRPAINNNPGITMDDLLKNALRMRPDRIIVGEVRGEEANTLFTAMDTGHDGITGTVHANNAKETILRLKSHPMNVPENNLPLLNLIVTIKKEYVANKGLVRFVSDVAELERMENQVLISNIFERNVAEGELKKTDVPSQTIERIAKALGTNKKEIMNEIQIRKRILEYMVQKEVFDFEEITKMLHKYYEDPEKLIAEVFGKEE